MIIRDLLKSNLVRFLMGGAVTVLCEYLVFYVLYVFLHWNLLLANSLSFAAGLAVSFMFNRMWAFREETYRRKAHHQMALYAVLAVSNLFINNGIVAGLQEVGLDPRLGKIIAILVIAAWNFVIYRKIIFVRGEKDQTP